jgi:hypothetical protein
MTIQTTEQRLTSKLAELEPAGCRSVAISLQQ